MTYKKAIKHIRKKKGLTQEGFADFLGVSTKTVYRYESGKSLPTLHIQKMLIPILEEYGISVNVFEAKKR